MNWPFYVSLFLAWQIGIWATCDVLRQKDKLEYAALVWIGWTALLALVVFIGGGGRN